MKNVSAMVLCLLLTVCLALYGPVRMAMAGTGAVFAMEICEDGTAKTVLFDAALNPVEPSQDCPDCLVCCQAVFAAEVSICSAVPPFVLVDAGANSLLAPLPVFQKRNTHSAPRGPPSGHVAALNLPRLVGNDRLESGWFSRGAGRPIIRDATA